MCGCTRVKSVRFWNRKLAGGRFHFLRRGAPLPSPAAAAGVPLRNTLCAETARLSPRDETREAAAAAPAEVRGGATPSPGANWTGLI